MANFNAQLLIASKVVLNVMEMKKLFFIFKHYCIVSKSIIIIYFQVCLQIFLFVVFIVFFAQPDVDRYVKSEVIIIIFILSIISTR